jgi:hypothetical protein
MDAIADKLYEIERSIPGVSGNIDHCGEILEEIIFQNQHIGRTNKTYQ